MIKTSPLSGIYRNHPVKLTEVSGWQIAENFGNDERELIHLSQDSVLVDWSHIGKISLSGGDAAKAAEQVISGASEIEPLNSSSNQDLAVLRLTRNDYLILCQSGMEQLCWEKLIKKSPLSLTRQVLRVVSFWEVHGEMKYCSVQLPWIYGVTEL